MTIVGIDEVGRGALAGPVVVGAAVFPKDPARFTQHFLRGANLKRLVDSKKLSLAQRERAYAYLDTRIAWSVGLAGAEEIDQVGLGKALRIAAGRALDGLRKKGVVIGRVEADAGLFHPYESTLPTVRTVKGDELVLAITLASIMAKVWRDRHMAQLGRSCPEYGWERNAGYGTAFHRAAISEYGRCPQHRSSFLGEDW